MNASIEMVKRRIDGMECLTDLLQEDKDKMDKDSIKYEQIRGEDGRFDVLVDGKDRVKALECLGRIANYGKVACSKLLEVLPEDKIFNMVIGNKDKDFLKSLRADYSLINSPENPDEFLLTTDKRFKNKVMELFKGMDLIM